MSEELFNNYENETENTFDEDTVEETNLSEDSSNDFKDIAVYNQVPLPQDLNVYLHNSSNNGTTGKQVGTFVGGLVAGIGGAWLLDKWKKRKEDKEKEKFKQWQENQKNQTNVNETIVNNPNVKKIK